MSDEDEILPLLDRRAPIIERLRNRRDGEGFLSQNSSEVNDNLAEEIGKKVAENAKGGKVPEPEFLESFANNLATELDVNTSRINEDVVDTFARLFAFRVDDIVEAEVVEESSEDNEVEEEIDDDESSDEEDDEPEFVT